MRFELNKENPCSKIPSARTNREGVLLERALPQKAPSKSGVLLGRAYYWEERFIRAGTLPIKTSIFDVFLKYFSELAALDGTMIDTKYMSASTCQKVFPGRPESDNV